MYKIPFAFFLQIRPVFSLKSESHTTGEFEKVSKMPAHCVDTQGSESPLFSATGNSTEDAKLQVIITHRGNIFSVLDMVHMFSVVEYLFTLCEDMSLWLV